MDEQKAQLQYTLRLADDAFVLGHRLSEWCSRGPLLEEDLALTNLALDLIGRAHALYEHAARLENKGRTADDLAYRRPEHAYHNHLLCELPNGDFAHTIMRQFFISAFEELFFAELSQSRDERLAAIASKTRKEVKYHLAHAADWVIRLGDGTQESHDRMQQAADNLWMYTGELFEMNEADLSLLRSGLAADLAPVKMQWREKVSAVFSEASLTVPTGEYMQTGGLSGRHTEYMGHILAEVQYLQRTYPDAKW
jgi:ring-1,2-phenylacetyl-CoA epoxidase subunit PaaC